MQSSLDVRRIEVADRGYKREDGRLERRNPRKNSQPSLDRADARKQVAGAGGPFQQCHQLALGDLRDVARGEDRRVAGKQQGQTGDVGVMERKLPIDRKNGVKGKSVSVGVVLGGGRFIKKKRYRDNK